MKKRRSKLRLVAGQVYYWFKKQWSWKFAGVQYGKLSNGALPVVLFEHQSLLRRQLKDVDMWMQENKIQNLKLAIERLNGFVLQPGEELSYWREIGMPTRRRGFVDGMVLRDGQVLSGVGGGLCQLSNLIYWMTLHTPLEVVERWRHGYDVFPDAKRTLPFGSGATCAYPYIDLRVKNVWDLPVRLELELTDTHLVGKWTSTQQSKETYEVLEKGHKITHEPWGGYMRHNEIWRQRIVEGEVVGEELVAENHATMMYAPLVEGGVGEF